MKFFCIFFSMVIFIHILALPVYATVTTAPSEILPEPGVVSHYDYDDPITWNNILSDFSSMSFDDFNHKYFSSNPLQDVITGAPAHIQDEGLYDLGNWIYNTVWGRLESNVNAYDRPRLGHESSESYWSDGKNGCFGVYKLPDGDYPNQHLDYMRLKIMYYAIGADADTIAKSKAVSNVCDYNSGGHINAVWIEAVTRMSGDRFKIDFAYRSWGGSKYSTSRSYCYYTLPFSASSDTVFTYSPLTVLPKVSLYPKTSPYGGDDGIDGTIDYDDGGIYITYNGADYYIDNSDHTVVIGGTSYYIFPHVDDLNYDLQDDIYYTVTSELINNLAYTYNYTFNNNGSSVDMSGIINILSALYNVDSKILNNVAALYSLDTTLYYKLVDILNSVNNMSTHVSEQLDTIIALLSTGDTDAAGDDIDYLTAYIDLVDALYNKLSYGKLSKSLQSVIDVIFLSAAPSDMYVDYDGNSYKFLSVSDLDDDMVAVIRSFLALMLFFVWLLSMRRNITEVF